MDRVICWEPSLIPWVAPIDTAAQGDHEDAEAFFLATHHPMHLHQEGLGTGKPVSEQKLFEEFSKLDIGNEAHVFIIKGQVGTGKSHVVKWLHAKSSSPPAWHEVYVEKHQTSLSRVIQTILEGLDGDRIKELRKALDEARKTTSDFDAAKDQIRLRLANRCGYPEQESQSESEKTARHYLHSLLSDPVLRNHLTDSDGPIHRITRLGMEGLSGDDREQDVFFSEGDLPLAPADLKQAASPTRLAVKFLARSDRLRQEAIRVLNEELPKAKAEVLVPGVDLIAVFDEVRRVIADRGQELVLYIEDLVLLHGIDRELAQVFTEPAGGGRCRMRVAIAVTTGHIESGYFGTLLSRASEYSMDQEFGRDISPGEGRVFVARYLNALRQDPATLAKSFSDTPDASAPSACRPCQHHDTCHTTFGASADGYGYYPYNEVALDRMLRLVSELPQCGGRFDAREVLRNVVRDPLGVAAEELPDRRFPSAEFAGRLDAQRRFVNVEVRTTLARLGEDGSRYISLLNFWRPGKTTEPENLDEELHRAFDLPRLDQFPEVMAQPESEPPVHPPALSDEFDDIDAWINEGTNLTAARANEIRKAIFTSVVESIRHGATGVRVHEVKGTRPTKATIGAVVFTTNGIQIANAQGGGSETVQDFEIRIERTDEWAVLLKALLKATRSESWHVGDLQAFTEFHAMVDDWAEALCEKAATQVDIDPAMRILALTSQPEVSTSARRSAGVTARAGIALSGMLRGPAREESRSGKWDKWFSVATSARQAALHVLATQLAAGKGTGAASILDVGPLFKPLRSLPALLEADDQLSGTESILDAQKALRDAQTAATQEEWARVTTVLRQIDSTLDGVESWVTLRDVVAGCVDLAHEQGLLPTADARDDLRGVTEAVPDEAFTLYQSLGDSSEPDRVLWTLVPDPLPRLNALHHFVDQVTPVITALEARVADEADSTTTFGPGTLGTTFRHVADAIDALLEVTP